MKNTLMVFVLLMLWPFLSAHAQTSSPTPYTCTRADLDTKRKVEYKKLYDEGKYVQAIKLLQDYLDSANCERFAYDSTHAVNPTDPSTDDNGVIFDPELRKNMQAYLWALSDIAYAQMKVGQYADCIALMDSKLHEYPDNWLELAGDKTLHKAFETNLNACKSKRTNNLTPDKPSPCPFEMKNVQFVAPFSDTEDGKTRQIAFLIQSVDQSFTTEDASKCIALVSADLHLRDLDGAYADRTVTSQFMILVQKGQPEAKLLSSLQFSDPDDAECISDVKINLYHNDKHQKVLKVHGDLFICEGGSAQASYDSLFAFDGQKFEQIDKINAGYH